MKPSAWIGCLFVLVGCSNDPHPETTTTIDSAGVRIIESASDSWGDGIGFMVTETPVLDLTTTGSGPLHEFFQVRAAIRLRDGGFAVANHGWSEIRIFDSSGRHLKSVGRKGDGPGEFQRIETMSLMAGDSIAVWDYWLRRITVLSQTGDVSRVISLAGVADRVRKLLALSDSGFVGFAYSYASRPDRPGPYRMPYEVLRFGSDGAVLDTVTQIGGFEESQEPIGFVSVPFGKDGHLAVHAGDVVVGSADAMEMDWYDEGGEQVRRFRVPSYDLSLTSEDIDLARRAMEPEGLPAEFRQVVENMEMPESRPAYSGLLIDSDGFLWAEGYGGRGAPEGPTTWEVFSPQGQWLGSVQTPPRFTVFEIGSDYVLGVFLDDLDVEHVQLLALARS